MPEHIYISGPMRDHEGFNFPAFFSAERVLREMFPEADICNPAREDTVRFNLQPMLHADPTGLSVGRYLMNSGLFESGDLREALAQDLHYITTYCDLVVLLPGWEVSKGAVAEAATAKALGVRVVEYDYSRAALTSVGVVDAVARDYGSPFKAASDFFEGVQRDLMDSPQYEENEPLPSEVPYLHRPKDTDEVRVTSPTGGQKGTKLAAFDQVSPEVEWLIAEHFGKGARKYDAHNFRKGYPWSLSYSGLRRHLAQFWNGEEYDVCPPDGHGCQITHPQTGEDTREESEHGWTCYNHTGSLHIVAVIWHAMVLTEFYLHHEEYDDRYATTQESH